MEEQLRAEGHSELWLWVYAINNRAVRFYKRQQYQYLGNAFFDLEGIPYDNEILYKQFT